jgi:ATP-dependent helicase/nuclease subunit A
MTHSPKFKIYSSSAGSGKTYTLSKEYIKLALRNTSPWYFNHILAVTFTNKAAEEMKERILRYLQEFSSTDPAEIAASNDLLQQVLAELQADGVDIDEWELRKRAYRTFKHIIHEYANFSVSTIDSFVQRIVTAFSEELGFPFNFEVSLESEVLLESAVTQMLERSNNETFAGITEAIESYVLNKADEGKSWNSLPQELANFGRNLLQDQTFQQVEKLSKLSTQDFLKIEKQLRDFCEMVEHKIQEAADIMFEIMEGEGLLIEDFPYGKSGCMGYFAQIKSGDYFKEAGKRATDAVENNIWTAKSTKKFIAEKIESIADTLTDCGQTVFSFQKKTQPKYLLFKEVLKQIKKISLLQQIQAELSDIQDETGVIHISSFNRKILEIVMNEPIPFIYERLGERYNHILIDEFQDTSTLQWHNFLPLIENALAGGHFNLAVGDAKQSIYRFRGGEMELIVLLHQKKIKELTESSSENEFLFERYESIRPYLNPEHLNTNYRSAAEIITFNNELFESIKTDPINTETAAKLPEVYDEKFSQEIPAKSKIGGHVQLDFLTNTLPNTEIILQTEDELMFGRIQQLIPEILADGFDYQDIAILCRKNKHARYVANLLKESGVEVISSDSLTLSFSDAVNLIIATMKVVKDPDNRLAKYETIYLYCRIIKKKLPDAKQNDYIKEIVEDQDVYDFWEYLTDGKLLNYKQYAQMSLYELAETLLNIYHLFNLPKESDFLFRFLDVVLDFQTKKSTHLTDFLIFWEQKKNSISISTPKGKNAVTVTSIHKSKGLEYPVVIVPYCNWTTDIDRFNTIWTNLPEYDELTLEDEEGNVKFLSPVSLAAVTALLSTDEKVADQYRDEREKVFLESLNMLYVALTRPTDRLYMIIKKTDIKFDKTVGGLLYRFVGSPEILKGDYFTEIKAKGLPKVQKESKKVIDNEMVVDFIPEMEQTSQVQLRHSAVKLFDLETFEKSKDYGNKIHETLARIRTTADIQEAIASMLREGLLNEDETDKIKAKILEIMDLPELKFLFDVNPDQVRNEREILMPDGKILRPDRVVRFGNKKIIILDYKTGGKSYSHKAQVKQYMDIYQAMDYPEVEGYLAYLETNEIVLVN